MKLDFPAVTVRHQKDDGTWVVAEPHHPLYSVATMVTTEHWDEGERRWKSIDVAFEHCANEGAAALAEAERLRGAAAQRDDLLHMLERLCRLNAEGKVIARTWGEAQKLVDSLKAHNAEVSGGCI